MKITLSTLADDLESTLEQIDPETGELPEGFSDCRELVAKKAEAVSAFILNSGAVSDILKQRAKELKAQADSIDRRMEWLKQYLAENMSRTGITEIVPADHSFKVKLLIDRDSAVVVDDEALLPKQFWRTLPPPPPAANKVALGEALKAGEIVPGAHIEYRNRLVIS